MKYFLTNKKIHLGAEMFKKIEVKFFKKGVKNARISNIPNLQ